jgi:protein gp37
MSKPVGNDAWWDYSWNPIAGCLAVSAGCAICYAAQIAGTYTWLKKALHYGLTICRGTRRIFNGKHRDAAPRDSVWSVPLRLSREPNPNDSRSMCRFWHPVFYEADGEKGADTAGLVGKTVPPRWTP